MAGTPSSFLAVAGPSGCVEAKGGRARTLSLQHVVGILDLCFFRQGQRPAIQQLNNLGLHFLRHPVPEVLRSKRKRGSLETAVWRQAQQEGARTGENGC